MTTAKERKRRNSEKLREAGLVRLYVPGDNNQFTLVPKNKIPAGARKISDTEYAIA